MLTVFVFSPRSALAQSGCPTEGNLGGALAWRGDAAETNWLTYRNAKNGLSFRYPSTMWVKDRDPASFHFDEVPDVSADVMGNAPYNPNIILIRFICARGQNTPEMAEAKASALLKTHPKEDSTGRISSGAIGSLENDGHEAIVSCGCGRAACQWTVRTLQPRECIILPRIPPERYTYNNPPLRDGEFPLLSIIDTVHFESVTK